LKNLVHILIFLSVSTSSFAQDVKAGLILGGNLYQNIKVDLPIYIAPNSYLTIIEENKGEGIINSHNGLNSFNLGIVSSVFYKKFSFSIEPQFMYKRYLLRFKQPKNINWTVVEKGFRIPMYLSYRLTKNAKSIQLISGVTLSKTKTVDFQSPMFDFFYFGDDIYDGDIYYGRNIFKDVLYHNNTYFMFMVGFTKPFKKWDFGLRFQAYLNSKKHPIDAKYFQIEWSLSRYLFNSKDIANKHYLYVE